MNPDAEAAFTPESGGFDLVAMAEGRPQAEDAAQAVAAAEPVVSGPDTIEHPTPIDSSQVDTAQGSPGFMSDLSNFVSDHPGVALGVGTSAGLVGGSLPAETASGVPVDGGQNQAAYVGKQNPAEVAEASGSRVSASSEGSAVTFDQLDERRKNAVAACGAGACGSCVQKCGAYNPDDSSEQFDLVQKAADMAQPDVNDSDFRSRIQFKGEEAQKRMAERKAAKAKEAQSGSSDVPTPEQRDQIIEIRQTAADPERVRKNLAHGHARMAERQKRREERMAEEAAKKTDENIPQVSNAGEARDSDIITQQQSQAEERSRRTSAEPEAPTQADRAVEAEVQIPKPKPEVEEATAATQNESPEQISREQTSKITSRTDEIAAVREHADRVYTQAVSSQATEESAAKPKQAVSKHMKDDRPHKMDKPSAQEIENTHRDLMVKPETGVSLAEPGQTSSAGHVNVTQAERPGRRSETRSEIKPSHSVSKKTKVSPKPRTEIISAPKAEATETEDAEMLMPQTDAAHNAADDIVSFVEESDGRGSVTEVSESGAEHENESETRFSLEDSEFDVADADTIETMPADRISSDNEVDMTVSEASDIYVSQPELDQTDYKEAEQTYDSSQQREEILDQIAASPSKVVKEKVTTKLEADEIKESDELDQTELDEVPAAEIFDHILVHMPESGRKYSGGGGETEDIWKSDSNNRGKKTVARTFKRVRSSSAMITHKSRRSRKKIFKLLAVLGRFAADNFTKQQKEADEGVGV